MDRLYDRSRVVTDWKCPRSRFWQYEFQGKGITKSTTSLPLFTGITVHDSLAGIATFTKRGEPVPIDLIAETAFTQLRDGMLEATGANPSEDAIYYANEQASLTEGMLRGFYRYCWPRLLAQYPIVKFIEQEVTYKHDGLTFMSKPDLILENEEGDWLYIEYKTTSYKSVEWVQSWDTAVQLHSAVKATEQSLGKVPSAVQIVGLYKGYYNKKYKQQNSPLCYAYKRNGNPPFTADDLSYEYRAGYKKYPTWEMEGGTKKWVDDMPDEILGDLFPMTAPIFVNESLVESFFKQRAAREVEIAEDTPKSDFDQYIKGDMINVTFPQKFDQCQPAFGWNCEFKKLCHGHVVDPLKEGFSYREPHHLAEMEQQSEA